MVSFIISFYPSLLPFQFTYAGLIGYFKKHLENCPSKPRSSRQDYLYLPQLRRMKIESPLRVLRAAEYSKDAVFHGTGGISHAHLTECAV